MNDKKRIFLTCICIITFLQLLNNNKVEAKIKYEKMYAKTDVNIRKKPNKKSKSVGILYQYQSIKRILNLGDGWSSVLYKGHIRYIKNKYITNTKPKSKIYTAPSGHHQKSYMDWKCITCKTSPQWKLKQKCHIGKEGIIKYKNRYCVAVGSYYATKIGTKFDLILKNGEIIKCVLADQKADKHTDYTNRISKDGSVTEFIVSTRNLNKKSRLMGDVSYTKRWNSEIKYIKVYRR